jgi:hypothetical protein
VWEWGRAELSASDAVAIGQRSVGAAADQRVGMSVVGSLHHAQCALFGGAVPYEFFVAVFALD